tara:strand:- start:1816 stop:1950 length:135 start_codon:yes stop_codon:yes gene_type:complete
MEAKNKKSKRNINFITANIKANKARSLKIYIKKSNILEVKLFFL